MTNSELLLHWPLVMSIEDCFVPESAAVLIRVWEGQMDDESARLTLKLQAMDAQGELQESLN